MPNQLKKKDPNATRGARLTTGRREPEGRQQWTLLALLAVFVLVVVIDFINELPTRGTEFETSNAEELVLGLLAVVGCLVILAVNREHRFRRESRRHAETAEKLQRAIEQTVNASNARSAFLAGVSHELRTPLNAIIGFAEMIRRQMLGEITPNRYLGYAEDILRSAQLLDHLVCGLLDLVRIEAGEIEIQPRPHVLAKLVDEIIEANSETAASHFVAFDTRMSDDLSVLADRNAATEILQTLISDAVHSSGSGGTVTIGGQRDGDCVSVTVADAGSRLDAHDLAHIFEPFVQSTPYETRLGAYTVISLTLVKRLVDLHGGTMRVRNAEPTGKVVEVRLPAPPEGTLQPFTAAESRA